MTDNPLVTVSVPVPDVPSNASSMQSITQDEPADRRPTKNQLGVNPPSSSRDNLSFLAKLTDAKKSFFGRSSTPDPAFSSADENRALLSYILSEPHPQLEVIQEYERNGAQLNAITDEGDSAIHLLARAETHSSESISIVDYLTKKGCDPSKQNDYGWTAGEQ